LITVGGVDWLKTRSFDDRGSVLTSGVTSFAEQEKTTTGKQMKRERTREDSTFIIISMQAANRIRVCTVDWNLRLFCAF
jgi:hypothetical protein